MARYLLILLLAGCAAPEPFIAGEPTVPPHGWVDYCKRHPQDRDCRKEN
jgi:predicted transglutaminase-like cysteine proteinase